MTTYSSILAWKIPWMEELGGLYSPWGCKESDTTEHMWRQEEVVRFLLNISFIAFQLNPQKYWGYKVVFINIFIRKHGSSSYDPCRMTLLVNTGMVLNKTIFKQKKKEIFIRLICVCSVVSDSLQPHGLQPIRLLYPWDYPVLRLKRGVKRSSQ